jgi:hypothetical protein
MTHSTFQMKQIAEWVRQAITGTGQNLIDFPQARVIQNDPGIAVKANAGNTSEISALSP